MKRIRIPPLLSVRSLAVVASVLLLLATGCQAQTVPQAIETDKDEANAPGSPEAGSEDEVPDPPKEEKYVEVAVFRGAGPGKTGTFEIKSDRYWRVTVTRAEPATGAFSAYLHADGEDPATAPNHGVVTGSGFAPVSLNFAEQGKFFVRMEDGENQKWEILIEEIETFYPE